MADVEAVFGVPFSVGAILALGALNAVVGVRLRDRVYLWYAVSIAAFAWYALVPTGAALLVYFAGAALFAHAFLDLAARAPRTWRLIVVLFAADALAVALPHAAPYLALADAAYLIALFGAGVAASRRGQSGAPAYAVAFAGVVAGVLIGVCGRGGTIPRTAWADAAPALGVAWEALVLAVALADRIRGLHATASALRRERDALEAFAFRDALTGLANRGAFDRRLDEEWRRASRTRTRLALVMIDVDRFKAYNDTYGHLAGDRVLARVGEILRAVVRRPDDVVARYGGEEFVILLPGSTREYAQRVAEEARRAIRESAILHRASEHGFVTISAGIAAGIPRHDGNPARLIAVADEALYGAKSDGRNRVAVRRRDTSVRSV